MGSDRRSQAERQELILRDSGTPEENSSRGSDGSTEDGWRSLVISKVDLGFEGQSCHNLYYRKFTVSLSYFKRAVVCKGCANYEFRKFCSFAASMFEFFQLFSKKNVLFLI